ncbi:GNAT family N-acetyltransferase [Nannocystaceae bacterium ST9]
MPYPDDPSLRADTLALLGGIWTRLPSAVERARSWGADWFEVSTPFVHVEQGRVVAHVGVLEIPFVLEGRPRTIAGIHAVCAHRDHRRRGHVRDLMERALAWIDERWETTVLWANDPGIYGRFGFVACEESIFVGSVRGGPARSLRPLSLERGEDVAFLSERLARRAPVSSRVAVREPGWLARIDLALWSPGPSLAYLPELECIVAYTLRERFLDLYDVIGERVPSLADLAARLGSRIDTAVVHFSPDSLAAPHLVAEPTVLIDDLMVRGPWTSTPDAFAVSPLGRC